MIKTDVLVIGAGPSGCVASAILQKQGLRVHVVEKEKFPRFVIGESLLPRCMEALDEAGLLEAVKRQGFQEKFGAKFIRNDEVCDFNFADQFTQAWNWTWQVPRAQFDQVLAQEIQAKGIPIEFEHAVESIVWEKDESITQVRDASGQKKEIAARFIIDSSGYGRVIPRLLQLDQASDLPGRQTYFAHMSDEKRLEFAEPNRITIVMADNNVWVWMIPFSSGVTSVGFVGTPENFVNLKGSNGEIFKALIDRQPQVAARFGDQKFIWEPRKLEGWSVTTNRFYGEGFVLTGNVTEFLDPIFSSGVTLAVVSGARAAHVVANKLNGLPFDWEEDYMKPTMSGVDVFRTYVKSWYDGTLADVFFAKEIAPSFKGQICSVLAGYVWDQSNPFVAQHDRALKNLASVIRLQRG